MIRQNLHTHSVYCDGKDTLRHMAETALEKGFDSLGFSGHSYVSDDDPCCMTREGTKAYVREVLALKEEYRGRLGIFLGIEEDSLLRLDGKAPFEFVIGSVHDLCRGGVSMAVDDTREVLVRMTDEWYGGDFRALARDYYAEVRRVASWPEVDIVGHLDLLTKFNEDESFIAFDDPAYVREATDTIDAAAGTKIFEVNTGAIGRGYRRTPYPMRNLLEYLHAVGARMVLTSDCHDAAYLDCHFADSLALLKACGFRSLMLLTDRGFVEEDIGLFR